MYSKLFVVIILGLTAAFRVTGQTDWDLNRCISFAIENNLSLERLKIRERVTTEELNQARRNLLPGISASSRAGLHFGRSVDPNTNDIVTTEFFNNSYEIGASLTLFNGFRQINQVEYQKFVKRASECNLINATDDLAFRVLNAYFEVLFEQGLLKIANDQVEASALNLRRLEKQVEMGMKSKSDLLDLMANAEGEKANRIRVENQLTTAKLKLRQIMNLEGEDDFSLAEYHLWIVPGTQYDGQGLFLSFLQWSPYFQSMEQQLEAGRKALAVSRAQLFPSLYAQASLASGFYETTRDISGKTIAFRNQLENNRNQYLGATLSIPVFSRGSIRSGIKKARWEFEAAKATVEEEKQKIYFEMTGHMNDLEALEKEYNQLVRQFEADQLAFKASEKKFGQGVISVVEFFITKNRLANSESQLLKSRLQWEFKMRVIDFY